MDDLKRLEGKTIQSIEKNTDSKNSYLIIKFKEGGKLNITSFPNSDEGVGQLDINLEGLKEEDIVGKRILNITEEFDGEHDHIIINFKDNSKIVVGSFSSSEDSTAGLSTTVYAAEKLVKESLDENTNMSPMRNRFPMQYEDGPDPDRQATEIIADLEDYLEKQQIYDEQEELEEIESWLQINLEDAPFNVRRKVLGNITRKYNIHPSALG